MWLYHDSNHKHFTFIEGFRVVADTLDLHHPLFLFPAPFPTADTENASHSLQQPLAARAQEHDLRRTLPVVYEKGLLPDKKEQC